MRPVLGLGILLGEWLTGRATAEKHWMAVAGIDVRLEFLNRESCDFCRFVVNPRQVRFKGLLGIRVIIEGKNEFQTRRTEARRCFRRTRRKSQTL